MKRLVFAALILGVAAPAHAEMTVATWLAKASALEKQGMKAMFSPDVKLIKGEIGNAVASYEADKKAAIAAGRKPPACEPPKTKLDSNEMMAYFRAMPPAQAQHTSVKAGLYGLLKRKYPCP